MDILIPSLIAIVTIFITHFFTKKRENETEWRKEKLKLYVQFINSLSGITDAEISPENEIQFAKACNDLYLFSSPHVISALKDHQDQIRITNKESSSEDRQKTLTRLIYEMRKDIGIGWKSKDLFSVALWTSGIKKDD